MLDRTLKMVASGRAKLQGTNLAAEVPIDDDAEPAPSVVVEPDLDDLPPPPTAALPPPPGGELFDRDPE